MLAVIKTGGKQYNVSANTILDLEKLEGEIGTTVEFNEVLAIINAGESTLGTPSIEGAVVKAEILRQFRDDKIIILKKRRRQNSRRRQGHRQYLTKVRITEILVGGKSLAKAEAKVKDAAKKPAKSKKATSESAAA